MVFFLRILRTSRFWIGPLALTMSFSAQSLEPATWQAIATAVASYFQSQEGQCQVHACNCDGCNQGAKNRCHDIARKIRVFQSSPNDQTAKSVHLATRSPRTVCMAQRMMGDTQWAIFDSHRQH